MKFNAKAKSFHIAVWGNFPAARDFAEPDTNTTSCRQAVGNGMIIETIIGIISGIINRPPTGHQDIE